MLQPLLGITNSLQMMAAPYDKNLAYFAAWSFVTTFLVSFQGFFASLFYCFLNGEVMYKFFPRFREFPLTATGGITQPRKSFVAELCTHSSKCIF